MPPNLTGPLDGDPHEAWLMPIGRPREGTTLVCFPPAGGNPYFFTPLARLIKEEAGVLAVALPGRPPTMGRPRHLPFQVLVAQLVDALAGLGPLDRIVFFGHSFGAILALSVSARLQAKKTSQGPAALVLSGALPPDLFFAKVRERGLEDQDALLARLRRLGGIPEELLSLPECEQLFLGAFRADCMAAADYSGPLDGWVSNRPMLVVSGDSDTEVPVAALEGWHGFSTRTVQVRALPGGHFYLSDRWADVWGLCRGFLDREVPGLFPPAGQAHDN